MQVQINKVFTALSFSDFSSMAAEYEDCTFIQCDFSNQYIPNINLLDCTFADCNFSNSVFNQTSLKLVIFNECKLTGADFSNVNPFLLELNFNDSDLSLANFHGIPLTNSSFENCSLIEVDFSESDLSGIKITNSNLERVIFNRTKLEKVDFSTSFNIQLDPELNNIKGAKFSIQSLPGLLNKYGIIVT